VTSAQRGELALQAAKALIMVEPDRSEDAIQLLERAIADLGERDPGLYMCLEAQLLAAAGLKLSTRALHRQRMEVVYRRALGDGPGERLLLANLADWTLIEGRAPGRFPDLARHAGADGPPAEVARRVAERAIAGGGLLREQGSDSELFHLAIAALYLGDFLDSAEQWLHEAIEDARRHGSVVGYAQASAGLAEVAYRRGDLASAEVHARDAATVAQSDVMAVLTNIMLEQLRLEEAERLLAPYEAAERGDHLLLQPIRAAAARLRIARGQAREGADKLVACGTWLEAWGAKNPSFVAWRSSAALALNAPQDADQRRELAAEEVALANALGQPRTLGIALRALGLLEGGSTCIELLQEAIVELERSPARLEHARALIDHGAALRRNGHRADAREPLREGLDLAHRCGATALSQRARQELLATGARPRRPTLHGRDALTPAEARVAAMAGQGLTTREIAQALFVTPKTVETHLAHAYLKLDIHTRAELPQALSHPQRAYTEDLAGRPRQHLPALDLPGHSPQGRQVRGNGIDDQGDQAGDT
jgi:DNA-binding CsgD family transcriptional regulator